MRTTLCFTLALWGAFPLFSQINFSANDTVPSYNGHFRPGANLGWYAPWTDEMLADIAAGNPAIGVEGVGIKAFRPSLPEHFLDDWGYHIRLDAFKHYDTLGIKDNVVFVGYPAAQNRDPNYYCAFEQSQLFENMYLPIWDGGANGTPVNDANPYALYIYNTVNVYKDYVRFWEIWNEPDHDYSSNGWKPAGWQGNWWESDPQPCDYILRAPVYHYIRMLRISYEVIKYLDPEAYVAIGGLGYPAFLDVILRNTDNPANGAISPEYPYKGGAWFDAVAFHSYPHLDGSLRYWSNAINGFVYTRHSDAAVQGTVTMKNNLNEVLINRGYDGSQFPEKQWIITESNIPRKSFDDYIGSDESQRNFIIKALVTAQQQGILQFDVFIMGDFKPEGSINDAFSAMGLYKWLSAYLPYNQVKNDVAIAYKTTSDLLFTKKYDPIETAKLQMPSNTNGLAFRDDSTGNYTYVLWAKTTIDGSEYAGNIYWFPQPVLMDQIKIRRWDYSSTQDSIITPGTYVKLTGSPIFINDAQNDDKPGAATTPIEHIPTIELNAHPSPFSDNLHIELSLTKSAVINLTIMDAAGKVWANPLIDKQLERGHHAVYVENINWPEGFYFLKCTSTAGVLTQKVVLVKG